MWCLVSQSCPALCDHMDCSPPGSSVHGDSASKNIRGDCYALLQGIFPIQGLSPGLLHSRQILYHLSHQGRPESESESCSVVSYSLQPRGLYSPWNSPGQNTGVGSLSLLQMIFPTQGLNPDLPQCRWILYQLSHNGSPRILEWAAYPFSSGSFQSRN